MQEIPEDLQTHVTSLVAQAQHNLRLHTNRTIDPARISLCARLLVAARKTTIFNLPRGGFVDESPYSHIGLLYGVEEKQRKPEEIAKRHRQGRAALLVNARTVEAPGASWTIERRLKTGSSTARKPSATG